MRDTTKKKIVPVICAAIIIAALGIFLATIIFPLLGEVYGELIVIGILIIYGLGILAVIAGVIIALCQRLKEIESGEEEDAKKY